MEELSLLSFVFLLGIAFLAGLIDSIAGGGGLLTIPSFLVAGIPPHLAIGTNKLQSSFGSLTAAVNYLRLGLIDKKQILLGVFSTMVGALLGSWIVTLISATFLETYIPYLLGALLLYLSFAKRMGEEDKHHRLSRQMFYPIFGLTLGFYDGFFGPGTGAFWTIALVSILGFNLKKATAQTKVMNFTSNIVSLITFLLLGKVLLWLGIAMGVCQIAGAYVGSNLVAKKQVGFVRVLLIIVVSASLVKLLFF